jgi:hypothetical protein
VLDRDAGTTTIRLLSPLCKILADELVDAALLPVIATDACTICALNEVVDHAMKSFALVFVAPGCLLHELALHPGEVV